MGTLIGLAFMFCTALIPWTWVISVYFIQLLVFE